MGARLVLCHSGLAVLDRRFASDCSVGIAREDSAVFC